MSKLYAVQSGRFFLSKHGWHLPSSTGPDSYSTLVQNYVGRGNSVAQNNYNIMQLNAISFIMDGNYNNDGKLYLQSSRGLYWSHASANDGNAYRLNFNDTYLYPSSNYPRGSGQSLRCLAR